eukprot:TRINITY_DN6657_c0_g2_i2.p1 TRINITY_DN6657_c0_g2~~TRINITY_DN6657_c0_g2_i2.p1  ORF type:complete len:404 (-),score=105.37 TRINITY_DN6657_c0_g2_i2:103-1314(-)
MWSLSLFAYLQRSLTVLRTRIAAVSSPIHILQCVQDYYGSQGVDPKPHVAEMFRQMLPDMCQGLELEMSTEILILLAFSTQKCIELAGEYSLSPKLLEMIAGRSLEMLNDFWQRHLEREGKREDEDFDEVEAERLEAEHNKDEEVLALISEIIGSLAKTHKELFLPYFNHIACSDVFHKLLDPQTRAHHRQAAICVFDDVVQFAGPSARNFYPSIFNTFMGFVLDPESIVRQACIYGIGQLVMVDKDVVLEKINDVLDAMHQQIVHPEAHEDALITVTENAVSTLAKICKQLGSQVNVGDVLPVVIAHLPLRADPEERNAIHEMLCDFIAEIPELVFGGEYERLPKVLSVLATVIDSDLATEDTQRRMAEIVRAMQTEIPGDQLQGAFSQLDDESKGKLQTLV